MQLEINANDLLQPSIPNKTGSTVQEVDVPIAALGEPAVTESAAMDINANDSLQPSIPSKTASTVQEVEVPTTGPSGEAAISESDGMDTKAKDSLQPSITRSEAPTVQESCDSYLSCHERSENEVQRDQGCCFEGDKNGIV